MKKLRIYYTPSSTDASTIISRNLAIYSNTYLVNGILMSTIYQADANKNERNYVYDGDRKKTFLFRCCKALYFEVDNLPIGSFLFNRLEYFLSTDLALILI